MMLTLASTDEEALIPDDNDDELVIPDSQLDQQHRLSPFKLPAQTVEEYSQPGHILAKDSSQQEGQDGGVPPLSFSHGSSVGGGGGSKRQRAFSPPGAAPCRFPAYNDEEYACAESDDDDDDDYPSPQQKRARIELDVPVNEEEDEEAEEADAEAEVEAEAQAEAAEAGNDDAKSVTSQKSRLSTTPQAEEEEHEEQPIENEEEEEEEEDEELSDTALENLQHLPFGELMAKVDQISNRTRTFRKTISELTRANKKLEKRLLDAENQKTAQITRLEKELATARHNYQWLRSNLVNFLQVDPPPLEPPKQRAREEQEDEENTQQSSGVQQPQVRQRKEKESPAVVKNEAVKTTFAARHVLQPRKSIAVAPTAAEPSPTQRIGTKKSWKTSKYATGIQIALDAIKDSWGAHDGSVQGAHRKVLGSLHDVVERVIQRSGIFGKIHVSTAAKRKYLKSLHQRLPELFAPPGLSKQPLPTTKISVVNVARDDIKSCWNSTFNMTHRCVSVGGSHHAKLVDLAYRFGCFGYMEVLSIDEARSKEFVNKVRKELPELYPEGTGQIR